MTTKLTRTAKATGPIKLSDLRKIVEESEGAPENTSVTVHAAQYSNQFDSTPASISVTWEVQD